MSHGIFVCTAFADFYLARGRSNACVSLCTKVHAYSLHFFFRRGAYFCLLSVCIRKFLAIEA